MISATTNYTTALAAFYSGPLQYAVEITGYSRIFTTANDGIGGHYPWLNSIDDFSYTINELEGGADTGSLTFHVQDKGGAVTGDFPGFVFEGKKVVIKQGFAGLAYADYVTLWTGYVDEVLSEDNNLGYQFACSDLTAKLNQVIYQVGDDGQPTASDHRKTLSGHPLDILLDILGTQLGLSSSLYDSTKIIAYRDGPFAGMRAVFHLDQGPQALDFVKHQLLKPLGGYLWVNGAGMVTINFFYPLTAPAALDTFGPACWTSIPTAEQIELINEVQFQFDKDDATGGATGNYFSNDTEIYSTSTAKYGLYGEQVIQADGMRAAFQGFFIARFVARLIFQRNGLKNLKFDQNAADCIWKKVLYEPGDIIAVTHPNIPDRAAGVLGITGKLFEIVNKHIKFTEGLVTYTMLDASYLSNFGTYLIAPNAEANYTLASSADKAKYMFLTNDLGKYSNGDNGHGLG